GGAARLPEATRAGAEGYVEVRALGRTPVRGLAEPVPVYEMVRAGSARTRLHASMARGLTRFVGRDAELEQLRRALEEARAGRGQSGAAGGEAAEGQSRP